MQWLAEWIGASSPVEVVWQLFCSTVMTGGGSSHRSEVELIAWMMGLQLAFGLVLALLASWQLRPIFRRQDADGGAWAIRGFSARKSRMRRARTANDQSRLSRESLRLPRALAGGSGVAPSSAIVPCSGKSYIPAAREGLPGSLASFADRRSAADFSAYYTIWLAARRSQKLGFRQFPTISTIGLGESNAFMWFLCVGRAAPLLARHPGRGRLRRGIDHLGARRRYLGQPDSHRPDRPRDHLCQDARCPEARAVFVAVIVFLRSSAVSRARSMPVSHSLLDCGDRRLRLDCRCDLESGSRFSFARPGELSS